MLLKRHSQLWRTCILTRIYSVPEERCPTANYARLLKREITLQHGKVRKVSVQQTEYRILIFHMRSMYDEVMWWWRIKLGYVWFEGFKATCSRISYTLKTEAIRSSETSVNKISTRLHIPQDGILHRFRYFNGQHTWIWKCSNAIWEHIVMVKMTVIDNLADFNVFTSPSTWNVVLECPPPVCVSLTSATDFILIRYLRVYIPKIGARWICTVYLQTQSPLKRTPNIKCRFPWKILLRFRSHFTSSWRPSP
jgi:hypothetical protein